MTFSQSFHIYFPMDEKYFNCIGFCAPSLEILNVSLKLLFKKERESEEKRKCEIFTHAIACVVLRLFLMVCFAPPTPHERVSLYYTPCKPTNN